MKLDQAKTILNRINRMFADVEEGGGIASSLERDLLKEYVRRLYESLTDQEQAAQAVAEPVNAAPVEKPKPQVAEIRRPKPAPVPAPVEKKVVEEPVIKEVVEEVKKPAPAPKPKVIEIPASVEADLKEMEAQPAFKSAKVAVDNTATVLAARPIVEEVVKKATSTSSISTEIKSIFEGETSNDLSEKLAGAPVKDLSKAMAINERLLAQNDLFGGSKAELDAALAHLNSLGSFEEATNYLGGGPATTYDWAEGERKATARAFAKLVRRRYV